VHLTQRKSRVTFGGSLPGIGVIYNPRSGRNVRDPSAGVRLARALGDHGVVREAASIDALYRAAEDFRKLDIDLLGISGGDGTSGVTISGFLDVYSGDALPKIAFLRGGTANTIADSLGVRRGRPEGLLARLLRAYLHPGAPLREVRRHVMRVRGDNARRDDGLRIGSAPCGFLFGTGVVCGYLREYYAAGPSSAQVAAKTLLRAIGSSFVRGPMIRRMAEPYRGSVQFDDATVWPDRDYLAVAAGTIEQIGLGFKPFYRADGFEPAFHMLGIYTSPLGFIGQLPRIWSGRAMQPGHTYEAAVQRVHLHPRATPLAYMVDGDLYRCDGALEVTLGPIVRIVLSE